MSTIADDCPIIDKLVQKMLENPDVMTDEELAYQLKTLYVAVSFSKLFPERRLSNLSF